jgi:hypothetical protein
VRQPSLPTVALLVACAGSKPIETGPAGTTPPQTDTETDTETDTDTEPPVETGGDSETEPAPIHVEASAYCDDLVPSTCLLPFPSDRYLEPDATTVTGWRLVYPPEAFPTGLFKIVPDLTPFSRLDGHSPATQIMTVFAAPPDLTGAALVDDIGRSLEPDSPTVVLDLDTGERVPHWVELDARADDPERTVLYLRLASVLAEGHRYGVAIRGLQPAGGGDAYAPSEVFAALRDGVTTDAEVVEARRPGFDVMFAAFADAGVDVGALQQAWWFHTASGASIRHDILAMRQDALDRLGPDGIGCTVTSVEDGYGGDGLTARRVRGTFTVPNYTDSVAPPSRIVHDASGLPAHQRDAQVAFTAIVPQALVDGTVEVGPLVTFGHGLLGTGEGSVSGSQVRQGAQDAGAVFVATDWAGMASEDIPTIATALADVSNFVAVTDRLQQGMINQIALTRTFLGVCRALPELSEGGRALIDPSRAYYVGGSQGGIYGATLLALSPDIEQGVLYVNGAVFPFMMERSIDYAPYLPLFQAGYPARIDQAVLLPMAQHLWDSSDPSGYLQHLTAGLDGIGPKRVLSIAAHNDAQVPNLSSDQAMRMVGVPVIEGSTRTPWGFPVEASPYTGSGYVTIDVGDPPVPDGNLSPTVEAGGHSAVPSTATAVSIVQRWLRDGVIEVPCDGPCDPD